MPALPRRAIPAALPVHTLPRAVLIACAAHGIACATEAPADAPAPTQVVEIRGSLNDDRMTPSLAPEALPGTVNTITAEDIATLAIGRDISNIFQRIPGVVANNIDQGDTGNGFRMRGFATQGTHGADTAIYIDGVPQNIPSSQGGAGHGPAFLEWMTADMIDSVAVVKGPVSALYGDQNRAGSITIATREGGAATPSSAAITLASHGGRRASLTLSGEYGAVRSLLVADRYRSDGFRHGASNDRTNLFWKLSTTIGDGIYSLRASYYRSDYAGAGYLSLPAMEAGLDPHSTQFGLPGFGDAHRSTLVFNRQPTGAAGWFATVYAEDFERSRAIATSTTLHTFGYDDRAIYGGRAGNTWAFGDSAVLTAGLETRADKGDALRRQYRDRQPTASYVNNQELDLLTYGAFVQGQYRLLPALKLHAGARYDRFEYDLVNRKLPAASTPYRGSAFTPKLGLLWSACPGLDVFANVAEGFRSPAAEQISASGSLGPLGAPGGRINAGIDPSKVRSHDLGIQARPAAGWNVAGAVYTIRNDDEIVNTAPDVFLPSGQTTRRGYEFDVNWQPGRAASAYFSYGRILRARLDNPAPGAGALLSVPAHTWKAGAQYRGALGAGMLTLNGDVYVTARNPYYTGAPSVRRDMPTYVRYTLRSGYDIGTVQASLALVVQPHRFASDIAYGTAAGLLVSTVPRTQLEGSLRYFF
ncbi:TonB-dependent receptor [Pseudoduganella umbonata]|uniref:Ligand-gated channel n=1 Tax=Pseudoduganella umbonata TaxID=864828 RepID=A0A4P8HQE9_9BURK|nr:TonB-dependent receptor [Pseudoduganella umbonata]MBB3222713.1 outer membrane receptor protein involved in Fe transport [Pseudoduganella umbonata]QCP10792.1 ligand-gated channel [Pseudoduganella umbonata]